MADDRCDMLLEGLREVRGVVVRRGVGGPGRSRELLGATRLRCQPGGRLHDAVECIACPRFVNFRPDRNRRNVTIRCQWRLDDAVADLMTLANALVAVPPDMPIAEADGLARDRGVEHLVVLRDGELLGIVCRCQLAGGAAGRVVGECMARQAWSLPGRATLADAAAVMRERGVGWLAVVDDGVLLGVVTRGDLVRAGVDPALLGELSCACPGDGSAPCAPARLGEGAVGICLDCAGGAACQPQRAAGGE